MMAVNMSVDHGYKNSIQKTDFYNFYTFLHFYSYIVGTGYKLDILSSHFGVYSACLQNTVEVQVFK